MNKLLLIGVALCVGLAVPALGQAWSAVGVTSSPPASRPATAPATAPAANGPVIVGGPIVAGNLHGPVHVGVNGGVVIAGGGGNMLAARKQQAANMKQSIANIPQEAGPCKLEELFRLDVVDGLLQFKRGSFEPPQGQARVKIEGSDAAWVTNAFGAHGNFANGAAAGIRGGAFLNIIRYDFDQAEKEGFWQTSVNGAESNLSVGAQSVKQNVGFNQRNGEVFFNAGEYDNGYRQIFNFRAPTLTQLQSEHPDEVRKYLAPLLRRLSNRDVLHATPADLYSVFDQVPAGAAAAKQVADLLPKLDADDFPVREAASKDLAKLGVPGVLAAMRLDAAKLSVEQKSRIDAFIANEGRRTSLDPAAAKKDPWFLLDAMTDDDAAVVAAAQKALADLLGRAVEFEPQADPLKRTAAVDALRAKLAKELEAKFPATAPAANDNGQPQPAAVPFLKPMPNRLPPVAPGQ